MKEMNFYSTLPWEPLTAQTALFQSGVNFPEYDLYVDPHMMML